MTTAHRRHPAIGHEATTLGAVPRYRVELLRLRHLRLLQLIAERGSLGNAARELGVSQPAATRLLRELETVFGAVLVQRDARGARLTGAGRHAVERLTIALASVDHAIRDAQVDAQVPALRIGCIQVAGLNGLPAALGRFASAHLGRVQLREGRARELLAELCAGQLDGVIAWIDETLIDGLPVEQLRIEPLWYGRMTVVAAASHPLTRSRRVSIEQIARWPWVASAPGSRTHAAYLRLFLHNGVPAPPPTVECPSLHTTLHIVSATAFLALAPDAAVRRYARLGMVKPLNGPQLSLDYDQVSLVTRRDADTYERLQVLRRALLSSARRLAPE